MNVVALTCPYCNAPASLPPGTQAGQRIVCDRCGEAFALRPGQTGIQRPSAASDPAPATGERRGVSPPVAITETPTPTAMPSAGRPRRPLLTPEQRRRRNRLTAGAILVGMVLIATLGLLYALNTVGTRRSNDTALRNRRPRTFFGQNQPEPATPAQLAALGYLPDGVNVLVGLNLAELQHDRVGRQLLEQPLKVGNVEVRPGELAGWCGLQRDAVDHLVLALATDDPILPRAVLLVRTRKPYDVGRVYSALKAERVPAADRKDLYRFTLPRTEVRAFLWCIDEQTLALTVLSSSFLEVVPSQPRQGLKHLSNDLRTLLEMRVDPGASAWVAGVFDERAPLPFKNFLPLLNRDGLKWLGTLRGLAGWVVVQESIQAGAALHFPDEAAARKREEALQGKGEDPQSQLKMARDGSWLTLQYRTTPETVLRALARSAPTSGFDLSFRVNPVRAKR